MIKKPSRFIALVSSVSLPLLLSAGLAQAENRGGTHYDARGVSPRQAAANIARHAESNRHPAPGVTVGKPAVVHHGNGSSTVTIPARGILGQSLTSTTHLTPTSGGSHGVESKSGTGLAKVVHGAVYPASRQANIASGKER